MALTHERLGTVPSGRWLPLLVVLAAASQALALALPGSGRASGLLQIAGLAVFYGLLRHAPSARRAAALGWCFATGALTATFWWLFISMYTYGGLAAPLAALAVLALAGFLALYTALAAGLWGRWRLLRQAGGAGDKPGAVVVRVLLFAGLWLGAELLRGTLLTGFPWGASGYAQVDNPALRPFAPWLGVYGVGWLAALIAAGLAEGLIACARAGAARCWRRASRLVLATLALPLGVALLGQGAAALQRQVPAWRGQDVGRLSVALLQGNIPQDEKFVPGGGIEKALRWYGENLAGVQADLLMLPETALPLLPRQLPAGYWQQVQQAVAGAGRAALIGIPLGSLSEGYTNSVVGIAPGQTDARAYRYDKYHLVPFGEFIPPLFRWFIDLMNIPLGDFNRGGLGQPPFEWRGQRIAPNICYEDLFGEEIARAFAVPGRAPTILANVSNIGWFGDTVAVAQHLNISRMRALEFDRPMLRATNTGATAVIDHDGRVMALARPYTEAILQAEVQGREGLTPYAAWASRLGLLPLQLLAALAAAAALLRRRVRPGPGRGA